MSNPNKFNLDKLLQKQEPLIPELEEFYREDGIMPMVKHPYIISIPHVPEWNAMVNAKYKLVRKIVRQAFEHKNYERYIQHHERPYRLDALVDCYTNEQVHEGNLGELAQLALEVWRDSEFPNKNREIWWTIFNDIGEAYLKKFADRDINEGETIYRGICVEGDIFNDGGVAWTTEYEKAVWFAERFELEGEPVVLKTTYRSDSFVGIFDGRGESEVLSLGPVTDFTSQYL